MYIARTAFLLAALVHTAACAAELELDLGNYAAAVLANSPTPFVVELYSSKCGACKEFAPTWHAFAGALAGAETAGALKLARVNMDSKAGAQLASSFPKLLEAGIPQVVYLPNDDANAPKRYTTLPGKTVGALTAALRTPALALAPGGGEL